MLNPSIVEDIYPLTPLQEGMLFHHLESCAHKLYVEQLSITLEGELDFRLLQNAWNCVIALNPVLRTVYRWDDVKQPLQVVLKKHEIEIECSICHEPETWEMFVENERNRQRTEGFDLREVPFRVRVCDLGGSRYEMIVTNHHILYDGWSNGILLKEFFEAYSALVEGATISKRAKPLFKTYIQWLNQQETAGQQEYWSQYLAGLDGGSTLSIKHSSSSASLVLRNLHVRLNNHLKLELEEMARHRQLTLAALFYSAWGMLLQGINRSGDVVFGTTMSGRQAPIEGIDNMVGLLINTIPLRLRANSSDSLLDVLLQTQRRLVEREGFATAHLTSIGRWCGLDPRQPLFDTLVVVENYPLDIKVGDNIGKLSVRSVCNSSVTNYDLTIGISVLNDGVEIDFLYDSSTLDTEMVARIGRSLKTVLRNLVSEPTANVTQLELTDPDEKIVLLERFNKNATPFPGDFTVVDLVIRTAGIAPDRISIVDMAANSHISFSYLLERAHAVAVAIDGTSPGAEAIVAVMMEQSIELATAVLGVMLAGCAYLPIDPAYPRQRINFLLEDSRASLVLLDKGRMLEGRQTLTVASIPPSPVDSVITSKADPRSAAYVIYTSGTTGVPKGVVVEHRGVVNMLMFRGSEYKLGSNDVSMQLFSFTFDGFVAAFFTPLTCGCRQIFPCSEGPRDFDAVEAAFHRSCIDHFICVPSLFQALLENLEPSTIRNFKMVVLAGDAIPLQLIRTATALHPAIELINEFGVTESSVLSSFNRHQQKNEDITIGTPIHNTAILMLDHWGRIVPTGVPGEICISGVGLARGYLNRPELTAVKFTEFPFRIYHSGDLGQWDRQGRLRHLGRIDQQLKIRGFRIESREIEQRLVALPQVKEAVVAARVSDNGERCLCAYIVPEANALISVDAIIESLELALPAYMIPQAIIPVDSIPLTATGKVDRESLPGPRAAEADKSAAGALDRLEGRLRDIWAGVLGVEASEISSKSDFFHLGGHSIKATILSARIHKTLKVKIPLDQIFKRPRLGDMARYIRGRASSEHLPIEPVELKEYYPMSNAQKRLWIIHRMEENQVAYNMTGVFRFRGDVDRELLGRSFRLLIQRHEILRTSFVEVNDNARQKIHPADNIDFALEFQDLRHENNGEQLAMLAAREMAACPFDLGGAPLLNTLLMQTGEAEYVFVCVMHHIIADAWSIQVLVRDLFGIYNAAKSGNQNPLPCLGIQYKDYCRWHNRQLDGESLRRHREYWLECFSGALPESNIPTDFPRPRVKTFNGKRVSLAIQSETVNEWERFGHRHDASLFMVLLAACNVLLHSYTGDRDIVIGSPIAGRQHDDLIEQIGFYVNTLALRTRFQDVERFDELLNIVKDVTMGAYAHQAYPFDRLIDDLELRRDSGRNPLFDVVLAVQNFDTQALLSRQADFSIEPVDMDFEISTFDLVFLFERSHLRLEFVMLFNSDLFTPETILAIGEEFIRLMNQITKNPGICLDDLTLNSLASHQEISIESWDLTI